MQAEGGRVPLITFNWLMEREERPRTDGCAAAFPPVHGPHVLSRVLLMRALSVFPLLFIIVLTLGSLVPSRAAVPDS